jgi:hypothetical protein
MTYFGSIIVAFLFSVIFVVISINDKNTLPVNMPKISPFGIDGNPKRLHYST